MAYVRLPLSGNVTQDFRPFDIGNFSIFSVNVGRSNAPEVEEAVLEVASYGRQLGRMGEALLAVIESDPGREFSIAQKIAIEDFKAMLREIARVKADALTQPRPPRPWWVWWG